MHVCLHEGEEVLELAEDEPPLPLLLAPLPAALHRRVRQADVLPTGAALDWGQLTETYL